VSSFTRLLQGKRPVTPGSSRGRGDGWETLPKPVPGHSTIDGVPVAVVAVRRNSQPGQLEVVRGYHPSPEWPAGAATPSSARRHVIPASSFIPHPRRELIIGDQRFFYSTVTNAVRCADCGSDDIGFGFVGSDVPVAGAIAIVGAGPTPQGHSALCEQCAEKRVAAAAQPR
jgi:hypothetical protein